MTEAVPCGWRDPSGVNCPISCYARHQTRMSSPSSKNADKSEEPSKHGLSSLSDASCHTPTSTKSSTSKDAEEPQHSKRCPMAKQISQPEPPNSAPPSGRRQPRESRRINKDTKGESVTINQYKLLETLGQGAFGVVKLVYNVEDKKHYAMKIFSKKRLIQKAGIFARLPRNRQTSSSATPLEKVYQEIAILKKLDHPNVVRLIEVIDASEEDFLYLVFELVEGGEIIQVPTLEPLPENKSRDYFRCILLGLEYLHSQKVIHRDIKPSNLLVTANGQVKIADLGACDQFLPDQDDANVSSVGCTPGFIPPEAIERHSTPLLGGKAADIWALGITLFTMVIGRLPWISASVPNLYSKVKSDPLVFPETPKLSTSLTKLLTRMLEKDPKSRITLDEIKIHPWVTDDGKNMLPDQQSLLSQTMEITSEDVRACVVHQSPGIASLCLVKAMLSKHSFQYPFSRTSSASTDNRRENTRRSHSAPDALGLAQVSKLSSGSLPALSESEIEKKSSSQSPPPSPPASTSSSATATTVKISKDESTIKKSDKSNS